MAKAVIGSALVRIAKRGIGLAQLLELLFRLGVTRIAVGMILESQLAVGAFDLLLGGRAFNRQDFVVVAFALADQRIPRFRMRLPTTAYLPGLRATRTIAGRSRRSFNL
jgi:hypothetical protein